MNICFSPDPLGERCKQNGKKLLFKLLQIARTICPIELAIFSNLDRENFHTYRVVKLSVCEPAPFNNRNDRESNRGDTTPFKKLHPTKGKKRLRLFLFIRPVLNKEMDVNQMENLAG